MNNHKINPLLSNFANFLIPNFLYPTFEYNKENLTNSSYIFCPNHTNNFDGCLIWSLLSKDYDIDTFMKKEFWNNFPKVAKLMPYFNVYPITRDKLNFKEIKDELEKLKDINHSLVIFPQGRHVDPEIMVQLFDYNLKTLPLGAFYIAALSNKEIVPIYLEPQKKFDRNTVVYGNPINPQEFDVVDNRGRIDKKNILLLSRKWLTEINKCYKLASELEGRKMREYTLEEVYFTAKGERLDCNDPNIIANYLEEIKKMSDLNLDTNINDIYKLGRLLDIPESNIEVIQKVKNIYESQLVK